MCDKIKQFLALDWRKNILFIVLFLFIFPLMDAIFLPQYISIESMGFPFIYYSYHVAMPSETAIFSFLPFILDILICYVISCFIIDKTFKIQNKEFIRLYNFRTYYNNNRMDFCEICDWLILDYPLIFPYY